jgi:hypothetical protein
MVTGKQNVKLQIVAYRTGLQASAAEIVGVWLV